MPSSLSSRARARALADRERLVDTVEASRLTDLSETTLLIYRSVGRLPADVELSREQWLAQGKPRARLFYKIGSLVDYMSRTKPSYPRTRRRK